MRWKKYKRYNKRHARKLFVRNQVHKLWRRQINHSEQNIRQIISKAKNEGFSIVSVPSNFTFSKNTKRVLEVIEQIDKFLKQKKWTFIDLENVTVIDNGSITVLLAKMTEFKLENVRFNGSFPKNKKAKSLILSSGFLNHLYSKIKIIDGLFDDTPFNAYGKANQIITKPGNMVIPKIAKGICESVSSTTRMDPIISTKGVYKTLIELMHNTNNHATYDKNNKEFWWLTVNHDKDKRKVSFVFLDFGIGIFESLKNKPETNPLYGIYIKIMEKINYGTDADVLDLILKGELHRTSTKLANRGKGLNGIYEVHKRGQIENLIIISNSVFADVSKNDFKSMNFNFGGTFVYWEVNGGE